MAFICSPPSDHRLVKVLEIDEPNLIKFSWDTDGWIVSFILKDLGNQTEFTLIHGGWKTSNDTISKVQRSASEVRETMNKGWEQIVHEKLKKAVEG
jgi:uncharacterized protein YndB with AHSA1/START domain